MFLIICRKFNHEFLPMSKGINEMLKPYDIIIKEGNNWVKEKINKKEVEDIYIKSKDNLRLHGLFIENKKSKGVIIEVHGYRSTAERDLYTSCHKYYEMGYSLLLIDNRTSNKSEGKYITFGIRESEDVILWINYLNKRFPRLNIVLAGISMGASTVLMSLNDIKESNNIKCALVDCGYISAYKEVLYCIKHYFHINGKLFIHMIDFWCKLFAKFSFKEKNTVDSLKNTRIPILFVHGLIDDFVPCKNTQINYEKYIGKKKMIIFEEATHGLSYLVDSNKYISGVKEFLD
jgi:fermentation-respiration switch protein FrsA (DUF1100 family)